MSRLNLQLCPGTRRTYHLLGSHDDGLDGKFAPAHVKEVFQRWAEEVDDEDVVKPLLPKVVDLRDARASCEDFVCAVLVSQLWCITLAWLLQIGVAFYCVRC